MEYHYVGNKAKGRISKQVLQENKASQIFRKTNISYPLMPIRKTDIPCTLIRMSAYQEVRNVCFRENLACFVFL